MKLTASHPNRQSESDINSDPIKIGDSASPISDASENATAPRDGQQISDDDMLLKVIEAWASLTSAQRRMILAIITR